MVAYQLPTLRSQLGGSRPNGSHHGDSRFESYHLRRGTEPATGIVIPSPRAPAHPRHLGVRDFRDDGVPAGGVLVGLALSIPIWVMIIALLVVLL